MSMKHEDLSPMMAQYLDIKKNVGDAILLFRVGDFYETFGDDAVLASRVLDITLTKKFIGKGNTVPLAGVPHHAVDGYIYRLTREGYRVALCDQVEDPREAKKVVKREVVRTITPGTLMESEVLTSDQNNYLAAIWDGDPTGVGLAMIDISTGEFRATSFTGGNAMADLAGELAKYSPAECLIAESLGSVSNIEETITRETRAFTSRADTNSFTTKEIEKSHIEVREEKNDDPDVGATQGLSPRQRHLAVAAAGAVWSYVRETQKRRLSHVLELILYRPNDHMILDSATERNLEILQNQRDGGVKGSLLGVLKRTTTSAGGRLLRKWLSRPLIHHKAIQARLDAVQELYQGPLLRNAIRELLHEVHDLERLTGRISFGNANARDVLALGRSLSMVPKLAEVLSKDPELRYTRQYIGPLEGIPELEGLIARAIVDEPPMTIREGGIIRQGFSEDLDELREISRSGKDWIARLQTEERAKTGISSLKIGYNRVFGYYIEVTKPNLPMVPQSWVRKQTLVNAERFITESLKEYESKVLGAEERIQGLEYELFRGVRDEAAKYAAPLKDIAAKLARLDVLLSFAEAAAQNSYLRPEIHTGGEIDIVEGRHPVLEASGMDHLFVPNDSHLDMEKRQIQVITGPNMAGKSTYIRQMALIVLMGQVGSFVPAKSAKIGLVDRIFTRVGASDNLARGESTFMVEMKEAAHILRNATPRSLVILDEIGRGTSTYDGISIAWAIAEHLHNLKARGVKSLFATHYHELAELEQILPRAVNLRVLVSEQSGKVTFLYQIAPGYSDHSYGIHVAELAGLPPSVIRRARRILKDLESDEILPEERPQSKSAVQLSLFSMIEDPILLRLREVDVDSLSPLEALNELSRLVSEARNKPS